MCIKVLDPSDKGPCYFSNFYLKESVAAVSRQPSMVESYSCERVSVEYLIRLDDLLHGAGTDV